MSMGEPWHCLGTSQVASPGHASMASSWLACLPWALIAISVGVLMCPAHALLLWLAHGWPLFMGILWHCNGASHVPSPWHAAMAESWGEGWLAMSMGIPWHCLGTSQVASPCHASMASSWLACLPWVLNAISLGVLMCPAHAMLLWLAHGWAPFHGHPMALHWGFSGAQPLACCHG